MATDRSKVLQQAQLLASRGQYDGAISVWKKLAEETPNDGSIHNSIGDLHLKRNASSEAASAFLQAGAAFRTEGATLKAIAAYKKVLKIDPTRYEVYRHLGDLNSERGLLSSAVQDYLTLGKHYLKAQKTKEALEVYRKIVSQDPSNLSAQQRVAELCVQENLQDEAAKSYLQLGRERSAQGRYEEAKDAYLAVLKIDPKNSEAEQFVEGEKKTATGTYKALKQGSATPPGKASDPLDLLAEATRRIEEKQYAGAEAMLNQMLTREPGNPQVCQLLARLHLQRGDVQIALGEYRFLAGAALRAQDYALAGSLIAEFLAAQPDSVPLLELQGELCEERGDRAEAAQHYARAVELLLEHPEAGMESLHEELFEKVRSLSPDVELVERLAARLRGEGRTAVDTKESARQPEAPAKTKPRSGEGFSLVGAAPDEIRVPAAKERTGSDLHFSVEGAAPDAANVFQAKIPVQTAGFSLDGAEPDGDAIRGVVEAQKEESTTHKAAEDRGTVSSPQEAKQPGDHRKARAEKGSIEITPHQSKQGSPMGTQDFESHFILGVAYKNMGLYQEAREEFHISKTAETYYLDSCLMTAVCYKAERQLVQAIQRLEEILPDPRCQGAKGQAIRYELGLLYEAQAQWEKAAHTFESIPSFHDVPQRLQALKKRVKSASETLRMAS